MIHYVKHRKSQWNFALSMFPSRTENECAQLRDYILFSMPDSIQIEKRTENNGVINSSSNTSSGNGNRNESDKNNHDTIQIDGEQSDTEVHCTSGINNDHIHSENISECSNIGEITRIHTRDTIFKNISYSCGNNNTSNVTISSSGIESTKNCSLEPADNNQSNEISIIGPISSTPKSNITSNRNDLNNTSTTKVDHSNATSSCEINMNADMIIDGSSSNSSSRSSRSSGSSDSSDNNTSIHLIINSSATSTIDSTVTVGSNVSFITPLPQHTVVHTPSNHAVAVTRSFKPPQLVHVPDKICDGLWSREPYMEPLFV